MKDEEKTIEQIIAELDDMGKKAAGKKSEEQNDDSEKDVTFAEGESQQPHEETREVKTGDESTGHSEEQGLEEVISEESFDQMFSEESSEKSLSEEPGGEPPDEPPPSPEKRVSMRISRLTVFLGLALLAIILSALFVYPTMYEHRSMKYGDKTYIVRINRITQSAQYYDGGEWRSKPLTRISSYRGSIKVNKENLQVTSKATQEAFPRASSPKVSPEPSATIFPETVVKAPAKTTVVAPANAPVKIPQIAPPVTPEEAPVPGERPLAKREPGKTAKVTEKTSTEQKLVYQDKKRTKVNKEADVITQEKPYTIQISSMRSLILAEMLLKDLKKKEIDAFMYKFETRNQGVWHVIFIGHFTDGGTATTYMKEEKINDIYPNSFVRKTPRYASDIRKKQSM